jgi:putative membrane protein
MNPDIPFRSNRRLHIIMIIFGIIWFIAAIYPSDRKIWFTENILPVSLFVLLVFTYKKFRFSNLTYFLIFIFLCFHLYGGHYTYNQTPFDHWLKDVYHTKRSYYDRVVHLLFGLFWTYPFWEFLTRTTSIRKGPWVYGIPVAMVFTLTSFFEILEWLTALFAGRLGQDYIGLQGDIFDTQKDMGLGLMGSLLSIGILAVILRSKGKKEAKH